jgi:hypothetical protein
MGPDAFPVPRYDMARDANIHRTDPGGKRAPTHDARLY